MNPRSQYISHCSTFVVWWHTQHTKPTRTTIMVSSSQRQRLRPQVYVHVEFGVSWTAGHAPRNHEVTYRSRALRERVQHFPRQVPAPNTNFLAAPSAANQRQPAPLPYDLEMYHGYYGPDVRQPEQPQAWPERRSSRAESRSSHERGQSAPPPFGDNPWDVNVPRAQEAADAGVNRTVPEVWKALPEVPSRYRLGEDGLPWSQWSVPFGYDPDNHPQDDDPQPSSSSNPAGREASGASPAPAATSPTEVSVFSPGPSGPGFRREDPGRIQELSTLGAALMTVDNGFENQWWYQGERERVAGEEAPPIPQQRFSRNSLGWAVASNASGTGDDRAAFASSLAMSEMLSPAPPYSSPDTASGCHQPLARTLSTRSDELFVAEGSFSA